LRGLNPREVVVEIRAEYGLSYGDALTKAGRRLPSVREALEKALPRFDGEIAFTAAGPDGKPRIEIRFR
jgi:hypothetical protein